MKRPATQVITVIVLLPNGIRIQRVRVPSERTKGRAGSVRRQRRIG